MSVAEAVGFGLYRSGRQGLVCAQGVRPVVCPTRYPPLTITVPATSLSYTRRLTRLFNSIGAQDYQGPVDALLVWQGPPAEWPVRVVEADPDPKFFCLARARNIGAKAAAPESEILVFTDADMALRHDILTRTAYALEQKPERVVTALALKLDKQGRRIGIEPRGFGGFLAVSRERFFAIGGYDEKYVGWGAEDNDMVDRLVWSGLDHYNLSVEEGVAVVHAWHPQAVRTDDHRERVVANRWHYAHTETIVRNERREWGQARWPNSGR